MNEVWKYKLIFVETPDANETSIALENYRRVRIVALSVGCCVLTNATFLCRRAIMAEVPYCCPWREGKCLKESTLTIITAEL